MSMDLVFDKEGRVKFDPGGLETLLEEFYRLLGVYGNNCYDIPRWEETEFEQMLWKHINEADPGLSECVQGIKVNRNPLDDKWQVKITLTDPPTPSDSTITL